MKRFVPSQGGKKREIFFPWAAEKPGRQRAGGKVSLKLFLLLFKSGFTIYGGRERCREKRSLRTSSSGVCRAFVRKTAPFEFGRRQGGVLLINVNSGIDSISGEAQDGCSGGCLLWLESAYPFVLWGFRFGSLLFCCFI